MWEQRILIMQRDINGQQDFVCPNVESTWNSHWPTPNKPTIKQVVVVCMRTGHSSNTQNCRCFVCQTYI